MLPRRSADSDGRRLRRWGPMWWLPWRRSRRQACWHDLVIPDDTRSGEMAEAVRAEIEHRRAHERADRHVPGIAGAAVVGLHHAGRRMV